MGQLIITFAGYVLLLFLDLATSASNSRCFPWYDRRTLCFTRPDPPVALSWSDAQQWCSNIGATLPIPYNYDHHAVYGNALGYFGLRSKTMWLGANSTFDLDDWYWTNGTRFTGKIDQGNNTRETHAYIVRNGTDIKFVAADPKNVYAASICQPDYLNNNELGCAETLDSYWSNGRCYTKNRNSDSWYTHASNYGGARKVASLEDLNEMTQWIDDQRKFWIGLRCTWWTWQDTVSGRSFELNEFRFGYYYPNNTSPECLASYDNTYYGNMYWMNRNCSTKLQFICQQYVDPTTTTKTTMSTPTTTRRPPPTTHTTTRITSTTMNSSPSKTFSTTGTPGPLSKITPDPGDSDEDIYNKYGLVVSLGFGLCGGLILAGIICLAALTAKVSKINRYSPKTLQKQRSERLQLTYSNPYEIPPFDNTQNL